MKFKKIKSNSQSNLEQQKMLDHCDGIQLIETEGNLQVVVDIDGL